MSESTSSQNSIQSSLPLTSSLRVTNSWKQFVNEAEGAIKARDLRPTTIYAILELIDPYILNEVHKGLYQRIMGMLIGPGFSSGRKYLYFDLFVAFIKKWRFIFINAPERAVEAYNSLVKMLFQEYINHDKAFTSLLVDAKKPSQNIPVHEKILQRGEESKKSLHEWLLTKDNQVEKAMNLLSFLSEEDRILEEKKSFLEASDKEGLLQELEELPLSEIAKKQLISYSMTYFSNNSEARNQFIAEIVREAKPYVDAIATIMQVFTDQFFLKFSDTRSFLDQVLAIQLPSEFFQNDPPSLMALLGAFFDEEAKKVYAKISCLRIRKMRVQGIEAKIHTAQNRLSVLNQPINRDDQVKLFRSRLQFINEAYTRSFSEQESVVVGVDQKLEDIEKSLESLLGDIDADFVRVESATTDLNVTTEKELLFFLSQIWDVLSGYTVYTDMLHSNSQLRQLLIHNIQKLVDQLICGGISWEIFLLKLQELGSSHNFVLQRSEVFARSCRIKDIRQSAGREINEIDRLLFLVRAVASSNLTDRYHRYILQRNTLVDSYNRWLFPTELFSTSRDPESINAVFRREWMYQEEWQRFKPDFAAVLKRELFSDKNALWNLLQLLQQTMARCSSLAHERIKNSGLEDISESYMKQLLALKVNWQSKDITEVQTDGYQALNELLNQFLDKTGIELSILINIHQTHLQNTAIQQLNQLHHKSRALIDLLRHIQRLKAGSIELEDALIESIHEIRRPFLTAFSFETSSCVEKFLDRISMYDEALERVLKLICVNLGSMTTAIGLSRPDLWIHLFLQVEPHITQLFSSLCINTGELQKIEPLIRAHAYFLQQEIIQLKKYVDKIENVGSDVIDRVSALFKELSFFFFGLFHCSKIYQRGQADTRIHFLDMFWNVSWHYCLTIQFVQRRGGLSSQIIHEMTNKMMSLNQVFFSSLTDGGSPSAVNELIDTWVISLKEYLHKTQISDPEDIEMINRFSEHVSDMQSLLIEKNSYTDSDCCRDNSLLKPFIYGDLSTFLK